MKKIQISRQDRQISRTETNLTVLPPPIGASEWKPIFKLLALIVLSDRKVFPESVKAFQDSLIELRTIIDPSLIMTRHMILDWLKLNKDHLANIVNGGVKTYQAAV